MPETHELNVVEPVTTSRVAAKGYAAMAASEDLQPFGFTRRTPRPHDVMVDDEENLYVCQWNSGKVYPYKFEPVK